MFINTTFIIKEEKEKNRCTKNRFEINIKISHLVRLEKKKK
jgi:hypothetical protein